RPRSNRARGILRSQRSLCSPKCAQAGHTGWIVSLQRRLLPVVPAERQARFGSVQPHVAPRIQARQRRRPTPLVCAHGIVAVGATLAERPEHHSPMRHPAYPAIVAKASLLTAVTAESATACCNPATTMLR